MYEFKMPSLGADMEAGRLLEWRVHPGETVKRGQGIAVVDTDKAAIEIEVWKSGIVREIRIEKGAKVPVGTVLALIEETVEDSTARVSDPKKAESGGREESAVQRVIARAMETSKREIPHFYLSRRIGVDGVMGYLDELNSARTLEKKVLIIAPVLWAITQALKDFPEFNGHYRDAHFFPAKKINPALVISLRTGGSLAPAILDADLLAIPDLMDRVRDLVDRTRDRGEIRGSEFTEGTITLTNLLDSGVNQVFGIIYPPQVAIMGIGSPFREAVEKNGSVNFRTVMEMSISADHRVSDGRNAAGFLKRIDQLLQNPGNG